MFITLIFLPLLDAMIAGFGGRWLGRKGACALTITGMLITVLTAYYHFVFTLVTPTVYHLKLGTWISSELLNVTWSFIIDQLPIMSGLSTTENYTHLGFVWILSTIKMVTNDPYLSPNPSPITSAAVTPVGSVMDPPLFLGDLGIDFLQNIPFVNGLGNAPGVGALIPLAAQLVQNGNPAIVPGAGFQAPAVLPGAFWPMPAPVLPLDPNVAAGAAGSAPTHWPLILLGSATFIFLAKSGWTYYQKKVALPEISENIGPLKALGTGKPLKYSLPEEAPWKNFNQLSSLRSNKGDSVSLVQIEWAPDLTVKILGFPVHLNVIPFVCITGTVSETAITLFLILLRKGFFYLVRQQLAAFWKMLLSLKIQTKRSYSFIKTTKRSWLVLLCCNCLKQQVQRIFFLICYKGPATFGRAKYKCYTLTKNMRTKNTNKTSKALYLREQHLFHLVNPSPWPFVVSCSVFSIVFGLIWCQDKFLPELITVFFAKDNYTQLGLGWVLLSLPPGYRDSIPPTNPPVNVPNPSGGWEDESWPELYAERLLTVVGVTLIVGGCYMLYYEYYCKEKPEVVDPLELLPRGFPRGFPKDLSVVPFICITGSLHETFLTLFLALLRRSFVCLVRQQIAAFWKVLLCCKIKNADLRLFQTILTQNMSRNSKHSRTIIIKTKIIMLHTAHRISRLLKRR